MRLTHEESRLFATLWLKAGDDAVLHAEDAPSVAHYAFNAIETGPTPCARERLPLFDQSMDTRSAKRPSVGDDRHSSWVH